MEINLVKRLQSGGLAVLPTDTIYGIHTPALNKKAVEEVYKIRGRAPEKPFIILVSSIDQLKLFDIKLSNQEKEILSKYWPGKVSVVLPCPEPKFSYLHRGGNTLAFRLPDKPNLCALIDKSGPLVSTSVNPEGLAPAKNIKEAKIYFGDKIDIYIDEGPLESAPSTVIALNHGKITILRQGALLRFNA